MKKIILFMFMMLILSAASFCQDETSTGTITVEMTGFRDSSGWALAALFNSDKGYPTDFTKAFEIATSEIRSGKAQIVFNNIPTGEVYAITAIHDADADYEFDRNWLFIPIEGWGTSNDIQGIIGPGDFNHARFLMDSTAGKFVIPIHY
jgi:uncharacterized protein (DUF2141 family)